MVEKKQVKNLKKKWQPYSKEVHLKDNIDFLILQIEELEANSLQNLRSQIEVKNIQNNQRWKEKSKNRIVTLEKQVKNLKKKWLRNYS